jgi:hypothetical protein
MHSKIHTQIHTLDCDTATYTLKCVRIKRILALGANISSAISKVNSDSQIL